MAKRRVVITGAAGYVAQRMYPELAERWDLVPIDVRPTSRAGKAVPGLIVSDLTRPDRNLYREHFRGADAVIHCGFVSAPNLDAITWQDNSDAKFWAEHTNVALAYNVCRVALEEGVRRVVVCSSNHAADYYERLVWDGRLEMVKPEDIRDENGVPFLVVYGVSGNTHRFWSIANARVKLGYAPEDDSQVNFADKIAAIARAARR